MHLNLYQVKQIQTEAEQPSSIVLVSFENHAVCFTLVLQETLRSSPLSETTKHKASQQSFNLKLL